MVVDINYINSYATVFTSVMTRLVVWCDNINIDEQHCYITYISTASDIRK